MSDVPDRPLIVGRGRLLGMLGGAVTGVIAGATLATFHSYIPASRRRVRTVAFGSNTAPFLALSLRSCFRLGWLAVWYGPFALVAGVAGVVLSPWVVYGRGSWPDG